MLATGAVPFVVCLLKISITNTPRTVVSKLPIIKDVPTEVAEQTMIYYINYCLYVVLVCGHC